MPAKVKHKIQDKKMRRIIRGLDNLDGVRIEVGIFDPEHAKKAAINAFGTSRIPARNFFSAQMQDQGGELKRRMRGITNQAIGGAPANFKSLGRAAEKGMKKAIDSISSPPNAASTVRQKGSSKPLVDTGAMREAVSYSIKEGG